MRIEQDPIDDRIHMISLCSRHRSAKLFTDRKNVGESSQCNSDSEAEEQQHSQELRKLEQVCYTFVKPEDTSRRLNLQPELIEEIFAYWVKKRLLLNNGKPLVDNLQDEVKVLEPDPPRLELPAYTAPSVVPVNPSTGVIKRKRGRPRKNLLDHTNAMQIPNCTSSTKLPEVPAQCQSKAVDACTKLENSLSKGRTLLELVTQKSKKQRRYLNAHLGAMLLVTEHLSKPVPLSQRTITFLNDSLETICSKEAIEEGERRADEICGIDDLDTKESPSSSISQKTVLSEWTPSSTSSSSSYHPSGRRNGSTLNFRNRPDYYGKSPCTSPFRSPRKSFSIKKRSSDQMISISDELEKERLNRRKSLRSSDAMFCGELEKKPQVTAQKTVDHIAKDNSTLHVHNSDRGTEEELKEVAKHDTEVDGTEGKGNSSISFVNRIPLKSISKEYVRKNNGKRHRAESKGISCEFPSPPAKRKKNSHSFGRKLEPLKSLNLKDDKDDLRHRLRRSTLYGELDAVRILRSRHSSVSPVLAMSTANKKSIKQRMTP